MATWIQKHLARYRGDGEHLKTGIRVLIFGRKNSDINSDGNSDTGGQLNYFGPYPQKLPVTGLPTTVPKSRTFFLNLRCAYRRPVKIVVQKLVIKMTDFGPKKLKLPELALKPKGINTADLDFCCALHKIPNNSYSFY